MANNFKYPVNFNFELAFSGMVASFQEISGISKEMGVEEVVCGGLNTFRYKLPTGTTCQNLVLRRALIPKGSKLIDWCKSTIDQGLVSPIKPQNVRLSLLNPDLTLCVMWTFYKAYPVKYSISDLKSQDGSIEIESIELAYTYFDIRETKKGS